MEDLVRLIVAKSLSNAARYDVFGLHRKVQTDWVKLKVKSTLLKAIRMGSCLTQAQKDYMLSKITNVNIN